MLLAQDLRRLDVVPARAANAAVRGLMNRVAAHFLKADGKPRTSDRIHPYKNDDYPDAGGGEAPSRRKPAASVRPVENILRAFSRDLNVVLARGVRRMFAIALAQYQTALNERSLLDFSDVLQRAVELLGADGRVLAEPLPPRGALPSRARRRVPGHQPQAVGADLAAGEGVGRRDRARDAARRSSSSAIASSRSTASATPMSRSCTRRAGSSTRCGPGSTARRSIARSFRAVPGAARLRQRSLRRDRPARAPRRRLQVRRRMTAFPSTTTEPGAARPVLGVITGADADECAAAVAAEIARILREETVRDKQTGVARGGDARATSASCSVRAPAIASSRARSRRAAFRPTSTRGSASSTPTRSRISRR